MLLVAFIFFNTFNFMIIVFCVQEIRFLRSQLTDAQTNLAVLRSELAQLRSDYEEQEAQLVA